MKVTSSGRSRRLLAATPKARIGAIPPRPAFAGEAVARTVSPAEVDVSRWNSCDGFGYMQRAHKAGTGAATKLSFLPTVGARLAPPREPSGYTDMWTELQRCVGGFPPMTDSQADSLYKQMVCHAWYGRASYFGGDTWDFEAWLVDVPWTTALDPTTLCQNYGFLDNPGADFAGQIVQSDDDDPETQRPAWLVDETGVFRRHIPSIEIYDCLTRAGTVLAGPLPQAFLDLYMGHVAGEVPQSVCPAAPEAPAPSPTSPGPGPSPATLVIDNRVTNGASAMREDTPAYLSTVTRNYCKRDGCALGGTDMNSGAAIKAICTDFGDRTTNGQDNSSVDDRNPGLYSSTRWYGIRWADGRFGFISEVWIRAADRGGKALASC